MDEFGFPYTLQSNASKKFYPNNSPSQFTVQLAERMTLDDRWVVGLVEIHFPLSFKGNKTSDSDIMKNTEYIIENSKSGAKKRRKVSEEEVVVEVKKQKD